MDYNFYTLANLAKRFLLNIDGGLLGKESEMALLDTLDIIDLDARSARMKSYVFSATFVSLFYLPIMYHE